MSMKTYTELMGEHEGKFFWDCDAGHIDGNACLDVLVYDTEDEMDSHDDNSRSIARTTVIDDRE